MLKHRSITVIFVIVLLGFILFDLQHELSFFYYLIFILVYLGVEFYGASQISSNFHLPAICKGEPSNKTVALTFDDGPSPNTIKVLDALKENNIKATFFCIGKNIDTHKTIVSRAISEGHIIANHSNAHDYWFDLKRQNEFIEDLSAATAKIKTITGKDPKFFRPPYGVTTPALAKAVKALALTTIGWNIRSLDTKLKDPDRILIRIKKKIRPGSIILLHDTLDGTDLVIRDLLAYLRSINYSVVPLDQLINQKAYA